MKRSPLKRRTPHAMKIAICQCCHRHQACACCPVHKDEAGTYATENDRLRRQLAAALEMLEERTRERDHDRRHVKVLADLDKLNASLAVPTPRPGRC